MTNDNMNTGGSTFARQGAWIGAIATIIVGFVLAYGVSLVSMDPLVPVLIWCGGIIIAYVWVIHTLRLSRDHVLAIEAQDAMTRREVALKDAETRYLSVESSQPRQIVMNQAAPPALRDDQLRTRDIPNGAGGYFSIPLSQLKALIEVYPATSRSVLVPRVVSGGADHNNLILAAEHLGWVMKPRDGASRGQGVAAQWKLMPEQAAQHLAGLYVDAEQRARGETVVLNNRPTGMEVRRYG